MTRHFFNFGEKFSRINLTERTCSESMSVGQLSATIEKIAPHEPHTKGASMPNREIPSTSTVDLRIQIDDLAKRALSGVRKKMHPGQQKKITETADWLTRYSVSLNFDLDSALDVLDQRSIPAEVLIDYCIPLAAEHLGNDWADDLKGFGQVTLATSRLQMILNNLITHRNSDAEIISRHGLMLIICKDEQHTLGPSILADQLRRRGQSVKILHSTDSEEIVNLCNDHDFSAVLFSCAGHHSLDYIDKSVKSIKEQGNQRPLIFIGGKILDLEPELKEKVTADAYTNDIELVISKVEHRKSDKTSVKLANRASR